MGIDFDESGRNDEYEADVNEATGEPGDLGKRAPAAPIVVPPAPQMHGNARDLIMSIMGSPPVPPAPPTAAEALGASEDAYMDEVEARLEVASYYRILLQNPMFDNGTKAANLVEYEVRGFIRERLGVLLSIGSAPKKETTFSDEQVEVLRTLGDLTPNHVTALKMIASKVLGDSGPVREAPVHRPAQAPVAPTLRQAPTPAPRRSPPAPAPASTPPQAAPTDTSPRGPGRPPGSKNKPKDLTQMVQAVRRHPDGSDEPLFNKDGSPRMVPVKRIQRPAGALSFPNEAQMSQVTAIQAGDHAAKLEANPNVQKALKGLQNPV